MRNCRKVRQANREVCIASFQIAEGIGFKGEFRQWGDPAADRRLITGGYRDPISDVPADRQLETACLTEENALSGRKHDLFSVL